MQLPQPQAVPVRKLTQTQPACPVLLNPPHTLGAAVRQLSVPISFHAPTVASRLARRIDAPRLPLTVFPQSVIRFYTWFHRGRVQMPGTFGVRLSGALWT